MHKKKLLLSPLSLVPFGQDMDGGGAFGCGAADINTMEFGKSNKIGRDSSELEVHSHCIVLEIYCWEYRVYFFNFLKIHKKSENHFDPDNPGTILKLKITQFLWDRFRRKKSITRVPSSNQTLNSPA
jgi:hypothetical protein